VTEGAADHSERARNQAHERVEEWDARIAELAQRRRELAAEIREGRGSGVEQLRARARER
jgi:hypothetical protein